MRAVSEEVLECRAGSDYKELIKKEGKSEKGCTLYGNKPSFGKQQSSQNGPSHTGHCGRNWRRPEIDFCISRMIHHKDKEITSLDFIYFFKHWIQHWNISWPVPWLLGEQSVFQAAAVSRMFPSPCCLVDDRKEEDELSLWHSTESLCATLFGVERKRVAALSHWLLSEWKGNRGLKCPHWMQPKRLKHIKMALRVHRPSLVVNAASKALFKRPDREVFLELPLLRIGVRLSTEAMWQMINFSGRLEARGSAGGGGGGALESGAKV